MKEAQTVDDFLESLMHARSADIRSLRQILLSVDPQVTERVKWNAPSFCWGGDDRITMRLHPGDRLELIFHRGAKVREVDGFHFDDTTGRIVWAEPDRGTLQIGNPATECDEIVTLAKGWFAATEQSAKR